MGQGFRGISVHNADTGIWVFLISSDNTPPPLSSVLSASSFPFLEPWFMSENIKYQQKLLDAHVSFDYKYSLGY